MSRPRLRDPDLNDRRQLAVWVGVVGQHRDVHGDVPGGLDHIVCGHRWLVEFNCHCSNSGFLVLDGGHRHLGHELGLLTQLLVDHHRVGHGDFVAGQEREAGSHLRMWPDASRRRNRSDRHLVDAEPGASRQINTIGSEPDLGGIGDEAADIDGLGLVDRFGEAGPGPGQQIDGSEVPFTGSGQLE